MIPHNLTMIQCKNLTFAAEKRASTHSLHAYLYPPIYIFGFVGNILNLLVLLKMKSRCTWFLATMALSDILFFNAMLIGLSNSFETLADDRQFSNFFAKSYPTVLLLINWFSTASFWSAVMVTVERLLAIMKPLSIHLIFSKNRLWFSIVCIFTISLLFQVFFWFIYYMEAYPDCRNLEVFHLFAVDVAGTKYDELLQFLDGTSVVVGEIVPFFIMLTINTWLIYKLYKEHKFIRSLSSTKTRQVKEMEVEHKVTIMAVAIMVSFFLFVTPSTITALMHMTIDKESSQLLNLRQVMQITHGLLYINKALNFPLYCLSSRHFRAYLVKILPKWIGECGARKSMFSSMSGSLPSLQRYHLVPGHGSSSQPNNNEQ